MRKLIATVASTAVLLVAGWAKAAPVTLTFQQESLGSDLWDLSMSVPDSGVQIFAVAFTILANGATDFSISQPATIIDPFSPTGFSVKDNTTVVGQLHIVLNVGTPGPIATGPAALLLGVLHVPFATNSSIFGTACSDATCDSRFLPGTDDGGTIQDNNFNSLAFSVHFTPVTPVPEPAALLLLGIGIGGLSLIRRRAA